MATEFKLLVLLMAGIFITECSIVKFPSKKSRLLETEPIPIEDIHKDIAAAVMLRAKRAADTPTYNKSDLHDTNNYGNVQYSGGDSNVIFVLTYKVTNGAISTWNLYISNNYGGSFTKINSKIGGTGIILTNNIFVSPEDPKRVYFADANSATIYLSIDEGVTFTTQTLSPNTISPWSLLAHPIIEDWVLARGTDNTLYVSRNLGKTPFTKIADNVNSNSDYQWGVKTYDSDDSIVYYNTDNAGSQVDLYTQRYPYDNTTRQEFDPLLGSHDDFLLLGRYIFVQKTINTKITLWVSADRKPFQQTIIPTPYNHQQYIVDTINSLQALVIVKHNSSLYNLYMSEEQGVIYYNALTDLKVDQTNAGGYIIDLESIDSMNHTTYIANQNVRATPGDTNPLIRTLISFDVGANWQIVRPPVTNDNECIQPLCSLHLHMSTSEYWRTGIYSQESAPGIIIAHGVTGQSLNDDNTNLFISRDGGSTWSMTLIGTWGVSVLDHGGLIVAARDYHSGLDESRTLMYTCNEGITWSSLTFANDSVRIFGVISEPGEASTVVSLYGIQSTGWIVVTVEFRPIFPVSCITTDYYNWTPFDEATETGCLLGAAITIERRLASHCCLNGENYTRIIGYSVCSCNEEDFECDYGYEHANGINGPCIRDSTTLLPTICNNGDISYTQSQGYHKIGGDVCTGGVESNYQSYLAPCCHEGVNGTFTTTTTWYITNQPITSTITTTSLSTITTTSVSTSITTSIIQSSTTYTTTVIHNTGGTSTITSTITNTIIHPSSDNTNSNSNSNNDSITIILSSTLVIALVLIVVFIVIGIVVFVIKTRKSSNGYSRERIAYHRQERETSPSLGGIHNINYIDDDDDDDKPLPL